VYIYDGDTYVDVGFKPTVVILNRHFYVYSFLSLTSLFDKYFRKRRNFLQAQTYASGEFRLVPYIIQSQVLAICCGYQQTLTVLGGLTVITDLESFIGWQN
jgi:hypothetical protein